MIPIKERKWYKDSEAAYNEMARVWNSLPGNRLVYPKDKFEIKYCYHPKREQERKEIDRDGKPIPVPYCNACGLPLPGAYDNFDG